MGAWMGQQGWTVDCSEMASGWVGDGEVLGGCTSCMKASEVSVSVRLRQRPGSSKSPRSCASCAEAPVFAGLRGLQVPLGPEPSKSSLFLAAVKMAAGGVSPVAAWYACSEVKTEIS